MLWIKEHKGVWRVAILVVALVAIVGPWTFDLTSVPSEYSCSAPSIRLDDDFCGTPLSWISLFRGMVKGFVYARAGLLWDAMGLVEWAHLFLYALFLFLLVLPFFSTLLLILRGDRRGRQAFNVAAWGLAAGIGLLIAVCRYPRLFWVAWGIWLYIGLAANALILEVLTLTAGRRPSRG